MNFEPAVRRAVRPLIGIGGPSGSGKTLSALLMARGLAGPDGNIIIIDTESRRSEMYADDPRIGGFRIGAMYPPFTSDAFSLAVDAAENAGASAIVIDSMSHEWNGTGGCIEQAEEAEAKARKRGPTSWIKPKRAHLRMMNRFLRTQVPVIFCLRTKPELITTTDGDGKQTFAKGPMVAEQEQRFIYEMTMAALLEYESNKAFYSQLKRVPAPLADVLTDGDRITVETGRIIRDWTAGGAAVEQEYERQAAIMRELASTGANALERHWKSLTPGWKQRLVSVKDECKRIAQDADRLAKESSDDGSERQDGDNPFEQDNAA